MSIFNLSQLEAFVAVAEQGSFSAAARFLGRAQSAISTQIANLELDTGLVLFERDRRKNELTQVGYELLEEARFIIGRCDAWGERAIAMSQEHETRLVIAMNDLSEVRNGRDIMRQFVERFPKVHVEILECRNDEVFDRVRDGAADLGVTLQLGGSLDHLLHMSLGMEEMACYCHSDHPLAAQTTVGRLDLARHRQMVLHGSSGRSELMPVLSPTTWTCHTFESLIEAVDTGLVWAVCPTTRIQNRLENKTWSKLKLDEPISAIDVPSTVVWRENREVGPAMTFLLDLIKQNYSADKAVA